MPSTIHLKRRIGSVKSTRQITKAMELVSASKMRRAQEAVKKTADYAAMAKQILTRLDELTRFEKLPLYQKRDIKSCLYIMVGSDRGLAGAYNYNVFKEFTSRLKADRESNIGLKIITIGRQAGHFAARLKGIEIIGAYADFPETPNSIAIQPIVTTAVKFFLSTQVDHVAVIYTDFVSSINQKVVVVDLLPAGMQKTEVSANVQQAKFEPSPEEVLETVTIRLIEAQLVQAMLSSAASEQSMRMVAMKNATDNAGDIIDDLSLEMNKARQAAITQELAEIAGGAEAMK